jgi:carboxyl-terminal processing protease
MIAAMIAGALATACASAPPTPTQTPAFTPADAGPVQPIGRGADLQPELAGVWVSAPFGSVIEVGPDGISTHEWDGTVCFPTPAAARGLTATTSIGYRYVRLSPEGQYGLFKIIGDGDGGFVYRRAAGLPAACRVQRDWDRAAILDYYTRLFEDHYAFLELRGIDWPAIAAAARRDLAGVDSDAAFFDLLARMIDGFGDSHTKLIATIDGERRRQQDGLGETLPRIRAGLGEGNWLVGILTGLLDGGLDPGARHVANERIVWGTLDQGRVGYLQVFTMGGFTGDDIAAEDFYARELAALEAVLTEAFAAMEGTEALILDLSNNRGGIGEIATVLAGYFAAAPVVGYTTQVPRTGFPPEAVTITPQAVTYTKPLYVLTSDVTVSGGEIATLALRQLPQTRHVGGTTRGSLSTVFAKPLPNGWVVELSNEIYRAPDGTVAEEAGLVPDVAIEVFPEDRPIAGHGEAIAAVLDVIDRDLRAD